MFYLYNRVQLCFVRPRDGEDHVAVGPVDRRDQAVKRPEKRKQIF